MADTDVQGMLVRIEATTAQLRQEIARGESAVAKASAQIDSSLGVVDKAFDRTEAGAGALQRAIGSAFTGVGVAAVAAVAGLVAITTKTAEYAQQVQNLSTLSNSSTTEFQKMAVGARTVGVEQEKLADIYKDTTDRAGEFISRGGGEMADFFKEIAPRVGVTAQMFANLSGPQALQLYYNSLEKAGLNQQQMTTYMEAMADEATALIPLLKNDGAGFKQLGDKAEAAGNILSSIDIARLVDVNKSIMGLEASFAGATRQLVVGMLPAIERLTKGLDAAPTKAFVDVFGSGINFLSENLNILAGVLGAKVTSAFIGYMANLAKSTTATLDARSANIAQAASAFEVATANQIAAQSAVILAEKEAIAARGTAVQTQLSIQLAEARLAERAATLQVAAAQTAVKAASTGILALLGGPAGIAALAIGAGIAFLTMGGNAKSAAKDLEELTGPLDQLIVKFRQMTAEQKAGALVRWGEEQAQAVKEASAQYGTLEEMMKKALIGPRSSEAGTAAFRALSAEMQQARASGASIIPVLEKAAAAGVSQNTIDSWKKQAEQFSNIDQTAKTAGQRIAELKAEASKPAAASGDDDSAVVNAANNYLTQLQKQAHTLQDKTALEQADRFIIENKIKSEGALAAKIRERAKAIDTLKDADKADKKGESEADRAKKAAESALDQSLKTAQTSYDALKKSFDPVGAASDELGKKTEELDLLFQNNKLSLDEYASGLGWLKDQYDTTVASATGLSQAMKYQADLEKQLSNARASYDAAAASVGMGDKESERTQAMLDLQRETNDKVLALRTELATATTEKQRQDLDKQIALTEQYGDKQVDAMKVGWTKIDAAQATWQNGATKAWQNYRDSAADIAGQTNSLFADTFSGAEDALTQFVKTGKLSFKDLANSIVDDLIRIQIRKALAGAVSAAAGTGLGGSIASIFQADGGVWDKGVQKFAKGGAFTNSVVTTPTSFGMSGGKTGQMGEAGPEAIMPLTRAADGSLGVRMVGGDSGSAQASTLATLAGVTQHFTFQGNSDAVSRAEVRQAAQDGAQAAYQMVIKDFKNNGAARQILRK